MFGFNELPTGVKAILALALVLALVLIAGLLLRSIAGGRLKLTSLTNRPRQPRLGVVDMFDLDRQRQLILLRRDNVEHLVMIGGPNDVVIEASILRGAARTSAPLPPEPLEMPAAEPLVEAPPAPRRPQPQPEPQPAPPAAAGQRGMGASVAAATTAAAATLGAALGRAPRAEPALEAALAEPPPPTPRKVMVVTPPAPPSPPPPPEPALPGDDQIAAAFEAELARADMLAPPSPPAKPIIEPIESPGHIKASKAEMEDMTRDLQEALRRPFSGVRPSAAIGGGKIGGPRPAFPPDLGPPPPRIPEPLPAAPPAAPLAAPPALEPASPVADAPPPADAGASAAGAPPSPADEPAQPGEDTLAVVPAEPEPMPEPKPAIEDERALEDELDAAEAPAELAPLVIEDAPPEPEAPAAVLADEEPAPKRDEPEPAAPSAVVETPATPVEMPPPPRAPAAMPPGFDSFESELAAILAVDLAKPPPAPAAEPPPPPEAPEPPPPLRAAPTAPPDLVEPDKAAAPVKKPGGTEDPFSVDAIEAEFARLLNRPLPPKG